MGILLATFAPLDFAYHVSVGQPVKWLEMLKPLIIGAGGVFLIWSAIKIEEERGPFAD